MQARRPYHSYKSFCHWQHHPYHPQTLKTTLTTPLPQMPLLLIVAFEHTLPTKKILRFGQSHFYLPDQPGFRHDISQETNTLAGLLKRHTFKKARLPKNFLRTFLHHHRGDNNRHDDHNQISQTDFPVCHSRPPPVNSRFIFMLARKLRPYITRFNLARQANVREYISACGLKASTSPTSFCLSKSMGYKW